MERQSYSLLEIIENPKRLGALPSTAILEYAKEAANTNKERFYGYCLALARTRPWALVVITLGASDVVPLKSIFKEAIENKQLHNFNKGSLTILQCVNQLFDNLKMGRLSTEDAKTMFAKKMESNLPADDLELFYRMIEQQEFEDIRSMFKALFDDGNLEKNLLPYFSFCYTDTKKFHEPANDIQDYYVAFKNLTRYAKVFGMFFGPDGTEYRPQKEVERVFGIAQSQVRPGTEVPDICYLYLDEDLPMLVATPEDFYTLMRPKNVRVDNSLPRDIAAGCRYIAEVDSKYRIVSFSCYKNNAIQEEKVTVGTSRYIEFPYLGTKVTVLLLTPKKDGDEIPKEMVVYVPEGSKQNIKGGSEITLSKYKDSLFLPAK